MLNQAGVRLQINELLELVDESLKSHWCVRSLMLHPGEQSRSNVRVLGCLQSGDENQTFKLIDGQVRKIEVFARSIDSSAVRDDVVTLTF